MNELKKKEVQSAAPGNIDITIIDGMFFLHLFPDLPSTFGSVASHILRQICRQKGNETHLIFDKIISPSIKDCERTKRALSRSTVYQITGPEQKRPTNWLQALRQDKFKEALVEFLTNHWSDNSFASSFGQKKIFSNCGNTCYSYASNGANVTGRIDEQFHSTHEEADSRMIFHLSKVHQDCFVNRTWMYAPIRCKEESMDGDRHIYKKHLEIHQYQRNFRFLR